MSFRDAEKISINGKEVVRLVSGDALVWQRLPEGYTELKYIETTGTQHIDTGIIPNQDTRIICEFMY